MRLVMYHPDTLEKGRKPLPEGTVREYSGMKFRKQGGKWVYVAEGHKQSGMVPKFASVREAEQWSQKNLDIDHVVWGDHFPLEHIEAVTEQMAVVRQKFPNVRIQGIGEMWPIDNVLWKGNFEANIEKDRIEYKGTRWRRSEAEKRVRKKMFDEPNETTYENDCASGRMLAYMRSGQGDNKDDRFGRGGGWIGITPFWTTTRPPGLEDQLESQRKTEKEFGKRFTVGGGNMEAVFFHEFGHVLDRALGTYKQSDPRYIDDGYLQFSWSPQFSAWWNELGGKGSEEIQNGLSAYGNTNSQEFFAELIGDSFMPEEHQQPLTKEFVKKFGKELGLI